ncbi:hypothetical protein O3W52_00700 [Ensifer psoraleae]|uniref:Uncharacterized protein n=2 Tax=Sinorhizobium psoraleae TaxID=520838 RepID=A0ABT4KCH6_9HYPH|nr:hypothetical protein [Sinorhizobium psoraleae]
MLDLESDGARPCRTRRSPPIGIAISLVYGTLHRLFSATLVLFHVVANQRLPSTFIHDGKDVPELPLGYRFVLGSTAPNALCQRNVSQQSDKYSNEQAKRRFLIEKISSAGHLCAFRQPAAHASSSEQNQRSPYSGPIRVCA